MQRTSYWLPLAVLFCGLFVEPLIRQAHGAIYQCKNADGRTLFSDQPCNGGVNKKLPDYEVKLEPYVSGRFTLGSKSFPVRQGIAIWEKDSSKLLLLLTMQPLSDTEKQQALLSDWSFLESHKASGLARMQLTLAAPSLEIRHIKTLGVEVHTMAGGEPVSHTFTLGGEDIIGHVNQLGTTRKEGTHWLEFNTQEFKPEIRWNVSLVLPLN